MSVKLLSFFQYSGAIFRSANSLTNIEQSNTDASRGGVFHWVAI